jgi:hypothetical protein
MNVNTAAGIVLIAVLGSWASQVAAGQGQEALDVYVLIGHNNARGWRCGPKDVPEDMKEPIAKAWQWNGKWAPLGPEMKSRRRAFGPALGFAHEIRKHTDKPFGVIVSGVPFSEHAVHWLPPDGKEYKELLETVQKAGEDRAIRVVGVYAVNGQNDARSKDKAEAFKANTVKLIQALRKQWKNPEMIFVSIRMHAGGFPHEEQVRKAQESIELEGYGWVDTDDVPRPDKHHYTPEGYLLVGRKFARKVIQMQKAREAAETEDDGQDESKKEE